jgi:hypothetical protein
MPEVLLEVETEGISPELARKLILFEYLQSDYHIRIPINDEEKAKSLRIYDISVFIEMCLSDIPVDNFSRQLREVFNRRIVFAMRDELSDSAEENELIVPYEVLFRELVDTSSDLIGFIGGPIDWDQADVIDLNQLHKELKTCVNE